MFAIMQDIGDIDMPNKRNLRMICGEHQAAVLKSTLISMPLGMVIEVT